MSNWSTATATAMASGAAVSYDHNSTPKMMLNLKPDFSSKDHSPLAALLGSRQQHQLITPFSVIRGFEDPNSNPCTSNAASKRPFWPFLDDSQEETSAHEATDMLNSSINPHQQKKKRLTVEQVKSLEVSFDMDNKLEPERKQELAEKLGLQPRQVAVWFQNRRARWKTKNLEQEYTELKSQYDSMVAETKKLRSEVARLTAELEARECKETADKPDSNSGEISAKTLDDSASREAAISPGHANCIEQQAFSPKDDPHVIKDHKKSLVDGDFQERSESISPACSDSYSDIIDAGSPTSVTVDAGNHEANVYDNLQVSSGNHEANVYDNVQELYEFEDHMGFEDQSKEETVGFTQPSVLATQHCDNLMDMANLNNLYHHQNLLTDITTSLFNEDPNGNHISSMADWLWELT